MDRLNHLKYDTCLSQQTCIYYHSQAFYLKNTHEVLLHRAQTLHGLSRLYVSEFFIIFTNSQNIYRWIAFSVYIAVPVMFRCFNRHMGAINAPNDISNSCNFLEICCNSLTFSKSWPLDVLWFQLDANDFQNLEYAIMCIPPVHTKEIGYFTKTFLVGQSPDHHGNLLLKWDPGFSFSWLHACSNFTAKTLNTIVKIIIIYEKKE